MEKDPHQLLEGMILASYAISCRNAYIYIRGEFYDGARDPERAPSRRRTRRDSSARTILGLRLRARHHRPPRRGRLHLRRGDRPDRVARGQARPAAHQAALPRGVGRLRRADDRQQRRDALLRQAHHRPRRRLVREDRPQREEHGPEALLRLRPRQPARRLRGGDGPRLQGDPLRRRATPRACRAARSSRRSSPAAPRRRC